MWTAKLGKEVFDLRMVPAKERGELHAAGERWACRGCGGQVHMRRHPEMDDRTRLDVYDDGRGPLITFAHNPYEAERCQALGYTVSETPEHETLKARLARTATNAGWSAELEVYGDGCRADVVVTRQREMRVLEAQVASLGVDVALARHELYVSQFGPTTWTHTKARPWSVQVESLQIDGMDLDTVVGGVYEDQEMEKKAEPAPIEQILPRVLAGELRYVYWSTGSGDFGFFTPIGAPPARPPGRRLRQAMVRRGESVADCDRAVVLSPGIACANCGHSTRAGHSCTNPTCEPPSCPGCGRPWHSKATCPECDTSAGRVPDSSKVDQPMHSLHEA